MEILEIIDRIKPERKKTTTTSWQNTLLFESRYYRQMVLRENILKGELIWIGMKEC